MRSSNSKKDGVRRHTSQSTRPQPPPKARFRCCTPGFRMPSVFNIIRGCLYTAVLAWTVICLAIAVHFQNLLESSDLTRFVPFAIFVCSASLLIVLALLGFGFWKDRNPISTRVELGCLGLAGVLWLALGAFLASSESANSDVECFTNVDTEQEPMTMPGFNTETYHAQYRVLEAFSFFNVILILSFLLMLLILAIRHHRWGNKHVWVSSVTAFPWFAGADAQTGKPPTLPPPVSAKRNTSRSQRTREVGGGVAAAAAVAAAERQRGRPDKRPSQRRPPNMRTGSPTRNEAPTYVYWIPHTAPDKAHVHDKTSSRPPRDKYLRDASPRR